MKAGTLPTPNAQGNAGTILPVAIDTTAPGNPTTVIVNAVPVGAMPTPPVYTFTAAPTGDPLTSTLLTVSCTGAITGASATKPQLLAVR